MSAANPLQYLYTISTTWATKSKFRRVCPRDAVTHSAMPAFSRSMRADTSAGIRDDVNLDHSAGAGAASPDAACFFFSPKSQVCSRSR
jgi:hypothetical protein